MEKFSEMVVDPVLQASIDRLQKLQESTVQAKDAKAFRHAMHRLALMASIEREYEFEKAELVADTEMIDLVTELGFTICPVDSAYGVD